MVLVYKAIFQRTENNTLFLSYFVSFHSQIRHLNLIYNSASKPQLWKIKMHIFILEFKDSAAINVHGKQNELFWTPPKFRKCSEKRAGVYLKIKANDNLKHEKNWFYCCFERTELELCRILQGCFIKGSLMIKKGTEWLFCNTITEEKIIMKVA